MNKGRIGWLWLGSGWVLNLWAGLDLTSDGAERERSMRSITGGNGGRGFVDGRAGTWNMDNVKGATDRFIKGWKGWEKGPK